MPTLPPSTGTALLLRRHQTLKITNTHGRQVVDLWALNPAAPTDYLSMSHNHAIHRTLRFPRPGATLHSSSSRPLLLVTHDTGPGDHDTLIAACNPLRYERLGVQGWHASCAENYARAVQGLEVSEVSEEVKGRFPTTAPPPLNLWMNVKVEEGGGIVFGRPTCGVGDSVGLKALVDLVVVMSSCPMDRRASEDWLPSPMEVEYEVVEE